MYIFVLSIKFYTIISHYSIKSIHIKIEIREPSPYSFHILIIDSKYLKEGIQLVIYVVKPGDSVWSIARSFNVNPQSIMDDNKITPSTALVDGQTLVIKANSKTYIVKAGDNLWSIARMFGVSPDNIARINNISNPAQIYPGLTITIPTAAKKYGDIEVNAFIQPSTPDKEKVVIDEAVNYLTYITPFSHHITQDGGLTPLDDANILSIAKANNTKTMLSVTNITGTTGANFNTELIGNILNDNALQDKLINNMLDLIKTDGHKGVIIDFEKIPPKDREKYNDFLRKVVSKLHPDYLVATALAPKTYDVKSGAWHGAHDYKAHGEIVDFVIIMTYEWGWSGGPPLAVAPINEVNKVISYAVSVIPPKKIMMGIPLYGYDWTLPYMPGGEFAESIGNQEAIDRASKVGAVIKYDVKAQSPYYNYIDKDKNQHVVWFEDARSVATKYRLASSYGLRGVSYWALGNLFPQNWQVLDDMFFIKKNL